MKKFLLFSILVASLLVGCSSGSSNMGISNSEVSDGIGGSKSDFSQGNESENAADAVEGSDSESATTKNDAGNTSENKSEASTSNPSKSVIDLEKIIYTGDLGIEVEDVQAVEKKVLRQIESMGGFIENSNLNMHDGSEYHTYRISARVPSQKFDEVINSLGNLGKIRNKSTNAMNITQQYSSVTSQLGVYEKQRNYYLKELDKCKNDDTRLKIQQRIFELANQIANLQSQLSKYDTDVAYSTINITLLQKIKEEEREEKEEDTLSYKMKEMLDTVGDSLSDLLVIVLEFIIIGLPHLLVYALFIIIIIYLVLFILKATGIIKKDIGLFSLIGKRKKSKKKKGKEENTIPENKQQ